MAFIKNTSHDDDEKKKKSGLTLPKQNTAGGQAFTGDLVRRGRIDDYYGALVVCVGCRRC